MSEITGTPIELGDYACLEISGEDAGAFLQGQLSNDVRQIGPGEGQLSTFNDPQGRVIAILRLFRVPGGFVGALPRPLLEPVARRLGMFLLRARAVITAPAPWRVFGHSGRPPVSLADSPALRLPGDDLWISVRHGDPGSASAASPAWAALETRSGIPEVYPETSGRFVAQMLCLDRLAAISFTKGCFVGQEVIARAHHLGRVKRHAHLYRCADRSVGPGDPVTLDDGKVGEIARVADDPDARLVLAVIRDGTSGGLQAAGQLLEPLPDPESYLAGDD